MKRMEEAAVTGGGPPEGAPDDLRALGMGAAGEGGVVVLERATFF